MARYGEVVLSIAPIAATAVVAGACGTQGGGTQKEVREVQRESRSIQAQTAHSVRTELRMDANRLMEADFSCKVADWKPIGGRHGR